MTPEDARKFAFALDGLIRSRTKGHGGEVFARKCINEMAEALTDKPTTVTALLPEERGVDTSCQPLTGDGRRLKDAIRNEHFPSGPF